MCNYGNNLLWIIILLILFGGFNGCGYGLTTTGGCGCNDNSNGCGCGC